jgi:hypothetical protein
MDTVFKDGTAAAKPFYIKDGRAYGPGVMDDKGGVVAGLYALKILQQIGFKDYGQITFLLDTNEETGSVGTSALIERIAKQHDVALNLEPGRPADGLVVERNSRRAATAGRATKASSTRCTSLKSSKPTRSPRAVEAHQVAHPREDRDVGDGVLVAHHPGFLPFRCLSSTPSRRFDSAT